MTAMHEPERTEESRDVNVLIVDDQETQRQWLWNLLTAEGVHAAMAQSGKQALTLAREHEEPRGFAGGGDRLASQGRCVHWFHISSARWPAMAPARAADRAVTVTGFPRSAAVLMKESRSCTPAPSASRTLAASRRGASFASKPLSRRRRIPARSPRTTRAGSAMFDGEGLTGGSFRGRYPPRRGPGWPRVLRRVPRAGRA